MLRLSVAVCIAFASAAGPASRKPPMGFNSWNHFGMNPSAELLLGTADAFAETGLRDAGYIFINSDDGWMDLNRTEDGKLHPRTEQFPDGMKNLSDGLHDKGFFFGIYGAAGLVTCGSRAGSFYHEWIDAQTYAEWGVDYVKYDDCEFNNIQSYVRFHVMKDALDATGRPMVFSFEPYIRGSGSYGYYGSPMYWVAYVGNSWRTGGDIRAKWASIMRNALINNKWAPVARPGHFNDADMLEVGNGDLTLAEQRSHFALWCLQKSPLLIGSDVRALPASSLEIMKNQGLIAINQDDLGVQGTLRSVADYSSDAQQAVGATRDFAISRSGSDEAIVNRSPWVTNCSTLGKAVSTQQWAIRGRSLVQGVLCLARSAASSDVEVAPCDGSSAQEWTFGQVNKAASQLRDASNSSCLAFNGTALQMEPCRTEPAKCLTTRCTTSVLVYQLWYLNSLKQLSSSFTNMPWRPPPFDADSADMVGELPPSYLYNVPHCLASAPEPLPTPPLIPDVGMNTSLPFQVWAGPLTGGDVAVLLLNTGDVAGNITATWASIGLDVGAVTQVLDLWTNTVIGTAHGSITALVDTHDVAAYRLSLVASMV